MDKREMEKLMDKYKAEMLEFSRRNNTRGYPISNMQAGNRDKREEEMNEALEKDIPFERDRSNPLPEPPAMTAIADSETTPQTMTPQPESTANESERPQVQIPQETTDAAQNLRRLCSGIGPDSAAELRERCRDINDFLAANPENGSMRVEAYSGDRAFGIGSARVMVFVELPSGNVAVFDGLTDNDGNTVSIKLPAPPGELSQAPQTGKNPRLPYAVYSVYVEHPGFVRAVYTNVPVFPGIESIQPVRMLAKTEGVNEPEPIMVDEKNRNTLQE